MRTVIVMSTSSTAALQCCITSTSQKLALQELKSLTNKYTKYIPTLNYESSRQMFQKLVHPVQEQVQCNDDQERIRLIFSEIPAKTFLAIGNRADSQ